MGQMLEAVTTTGLQRTTVHQQYNRSAFGMFMFGRLVPIVVTIKLPGNRYEKKIVMFGPPAHLRSPYEDLGIKEVCCRKLFLFNALHYIKCWLPNHINRNDRLATPYTYNRCEFCGASLIDSNGHSISMIVARTYRRNKFIWKASRVLQNAENGPEIFTYQNGVTGHGRN